MNVNIITIENIKAAVDKFAGRINIIVTKTGSHNSQREDLKVIGVSLVLDKYLATKTYKTIEAKVDV
jgi:hypothetical protein